MTTQEAINESIARGMRAMGRISPSEKIARDLDPDSPPDGDKLLLAIHAEIQNTQPDIPVEHRNVVLRAVAKALRSSESS